MGEKDRLWRPLITTLVVFALAAACTEDPKKSQSSLTPKPTAITENTPLLVLSTPIFNTPLPTPNIDATVFARMTELAPKSIPTTAIEFPSSIEKTARDYAQAALNGDLETIIRLSAPDVQAKIRNNPDVRQGYQDELDSLSFCRGRVSLQAPVTRGDQNVKIITFPFNTACRSKTIFGVPGVSRIPGLSAPIDVIRDNIAVVFQKTNGKDQITGFQLFNYTPVTK